MNIVSKAKGFLHNGSGTFCAIVFMLLGPENPEPPVVPSIIADWPLMGSLENIDGSLEVAAYSAGAAVDPSSSYAFDGFVCDGTSLLTMPSLSETDGFTVCGWVKASNLETNGFTTTAPHTVFRLYDSTSTDQFTLRILDGKLNGYHTDPPENIWPESPVTLDQWTFVAVVCDGEAYTLYQDDFPPYVFPISSANVFDRLVFGALHTDGYRPVNGRLRLLKLFDNALDEAAVQAIRDQEKVMKVADWSLMGVIENTAGILEATAYDEGTVVDPPASLGPYSMGCNGTSLYTDSFSLPESKGFTLCGWVRPAGLESGWSVDAPHTLFKMYDSASADQFIVRILDGKLNAYRANPSQSIFPDSAFDLDQWSFVAVACDGSSYTFYHNDYVPYVLPISSTSTYNRLLAGALLVDGYRSVDGEMRRIKLYDGALTGAAIQELYLSEQGGMVGDWPLLGSLANIAGGLDVAAYDAGAVVDPAGSLESDGMAFGGTSLRAVPTLSESNGFAVCGWVNPSQLEDGWSTTAPHTLFRLYDSSSTNEFTLRILDGKLSGYHAGPAENISPDTLLEPNQWTFVAAVCDGASYTFYQNDLPPYSFAISSTNTYERFMVGASDTMGYRPIDGKMRNIKLHDGVLSAEAVNAIYLSEKPVPLEVTGNLLASGNFEDTTIEELGGTWSFTGSWRVDTQQVVSGTQSLAVTAGAASSFASITVPYEHPAGEVVFGGWVSVKGSERDRNALVRMSCLAEPAGPPNTPFFVPDEPDYTSISKEYRPDTQPTYFEHSFYLPVDSKSLTLSLAVDTDVGDVYFDQLFMVNGRTVSIDWGVEKQVDISPAEWREADAGYRLIAQAPTASDGDVLWAEADFARFMRAYNEPKPVDRGSVKVWAIGASQVELLDAVSDYALPTLDSHYPHNGLVRWRARDWAQRYELYFSPMKASGEASAPGPVILGAGELLNYPTNAIVPAWGSWPGYKFDVMDADDDGDWDLYSGSSDEGFFICRNIGSNASPLLVPRTRVLPSGREPGNVPNTLWMDWDGDGDNDRIEGVKVPLGSYVDGAYLNLNFNENSGSAMVPDAQVVDGGGTQIKLEDATWYKLGSGDFDNDGSPDIVAGTAMGTLDLLLNRGKSSGKAVVEHVQVPFNLYSIEPYESGDMGLKPVVVDWDGDGDDDIVYTAWQGFFWLLLNQGQPNAVGFEPVEQFSQRGGQIGTGDSVTPDVVDWDNDGDLDLIVGNVCGHIDYCENIGTRTEPQFSAMVELTNALGDPIHVTQKGLTPIQGPAETMWGYLSCQVRDVDHDGDLDVIVNDSQGRLRWIENIGTRAVPVLSHLFTDFTYSGSPIITPWRNRPGVTDLDNDGLLDIFVLGADGEVDSGDLVLYEQASGGDGSALTSKRHPTSGGYWIEINHLTGSGNGRSQIEAGDFDGDGDVDLIVGRSRDIAGTNFRYLENLSGPGVTTPVFSFTDLMSRNVKFTEWTGSAGHEAWHSGVADMVDWDGDGMLDVLGGVESGRFTLYSRDYFTGTSFPAVELLSVEKQNADQNTQKIVLDDSQLPMQEPAAQHVPLQGPEL